MPKHDDEYKNKKIVLQSVAFNFAEKKIPDIIHVVPMGEWDHPLFGKIVITDDEIKDFIKNFKDGVRKGVPIIEGHEVHEEKPAIGWFKELIKKSDGLWGRVEWTEDGKELLRKKAFKFFSPEFFRVFEDPETGRIFTNVLVGGALTNKPFFKGLKAIVFSEPNLNNNDNTMKLKDLMLKKFSELKDDEKSFLESKKTEFSEAQWDQYKLMFDEDGGSDEDDKKDDESGDEKKEEEKKEDEKKEDDNKDEKKEDEKKEGGDDNKDDKVEGSEVKVSASEYKALQTKADKGEKAWQENRQMKFSEEIGKVVCSDSNVDGKLLPKNKDDVVKFMLTLSDSQLTSFRNIVKSLPGVQIFGEIGNNGNDANVNDIDKELDKKAEMKMSEDKALGYSDAVKLVFSEDKEFSDRYNKEKKMNTTSF